MKDSAARGTQHVSTLLVADIQNPGLAITILAIYSSSESKARITQMRIHSLMYRNTSRLLISLQKSHRQRLGMKRGILLMVELN